MMSVQNKINDSVVRTDGEKNDRLYVRINSDFKEKLLEKAKKQNKRLSTYILDIVRTFIKNEDVIVRTLEGSKGPASDGDVRTRKQTEINSCCRQLISLFDDIFEIKYPTSIINKLLGLLNRKIDSKLIETVKAYLNE
ncbi:MAG: hypothetical protein ACFE8A_13415 [Candidatus Hodarchaeota archaeon]